jgi:restriction endonuclease Mrr
MAIGAGPIGTTPIGAGPRRIFAASFDTDTKTDGRSIIEIVSFVDRSLIERLSRFPDDLRIIDSRRFEELVAELFLGFGYLVELTRRTRDGGKDIIAIKRTEVNTKYLIECKRPDPGNPIGVSTVRELYGVKVDDGATKAILATTTYFTADAKQFFDKHRWELEPRDFDDIHGWIDEYLRLRPSSA